VFQKLYKGPGGKEGERDVVIVKLLHFLEPSKGPVDDAFFAG